MTERKKKAGYILMWAAAAVLTVSVCGWYVLGDPPEEISFGPAQTAPRQAGEGPLDLNDADEAELEALPGIGPVLAERILAWRAENGPFGGQGDLLAVPGVGPALWEDIAPYVCFGGGGQDEDTGGG